MADLKISQLTGATTPLAGTEVLPIVQSSATKKVAVSDLTAGRAVSALSFASTTGASFATTSGNVGISTSSPITKLSNTATAWAGGTSTDGFAWRSTQNDWTAAILGTPASGAGYALRVHTLGTTTSDYPLAVSSGAGSGTFKFSVQGDGTTTFTGGNLVQGTAAKGINFTANTPAAGMTSRLLNWYEEGTWTPTASSGGGSITAYTSSGTYVRIGKTVVVRGRITTTTVGTASGVLYWAGLPFTSANNADGFAAATFLVREDNVTGAAYQGFINNNNAGGAIQPLAGGALTWTNGYAYVFEAVYICA